MSCEITVDSIKVTSVRRSIPILHRFSSTTINVASGAAVLITSDTTSASQSAGNTGFTYSNGLYRNTSGDSLVCLVSYAVLWNSVASGGRMAWVQLDEGTARYAMSCHGSTSNEPCTTGSAIIVVPNNSYLRLWVFQNSGFVYTAVANYSIPYLQIVII